MNNKLKLFLFGCMKCMDIGNNLTIPKYSYNRNIEYEKNLKEMKKHYKIMFLGSLFYFSINIIFLIAMYILVINNLNVLLYITIMIFILTHFSNIYFVFKFMKKV